MHYIVSFPFTENKYISLGDKCGCLKPEHISNELHRRLVHCTDVRGDKRTKGKTIFLAGQHDKIEFDAIYAEYDGKWIFCWHRHRKSYEHHGGYVEDGESPIEAAKRELYEETGVTDCLITPRWDCGYIFCKRVNY